MMRSIDFSPARPTWAAQADRSHPPSLPRTRSVWWTRFGWGSSSLRHRSSCVDEAPAEEGVSRHLARRHHAQHCPALHASVPPRQHRRGLRGLAGLVRTLDLTAPEAMAHDGQRPPRLPTRHPATRAPCWTHRRARRRYLRPKLDVDTGLDDSCVASLDSLQLPFGGARRENGARYTARHLFVRALCRTFSPGGPLRRPRRSRPETCKLS